MAKEKTELTPEQKRENLRQYQVGLLQDQGLYFLQTAGYGFDGSEVGKAGVEATKALYTLGLASGSPYVGQLTSQAFLEAAKDNKAGDPRAGAVNVAYLTNTALKVVSEATNKIKVSDMLDFLGEEYAKIPESEISKDQRDMYMEDFKEANGSMYKTLMETYNKSRTQIGMAQAFDLAGRATKAGTLEKILKGAQEKAEKKKAA